VGESGASPVILLVEDEDGHAHLVQTVLEEMDEAVVLYRVASVDEALQFLSKSGEYASAPEPNLVLLDLNMPRRNGYELLDSIRGNLSQRHIPVVIFSTADSPRERAFSLSHGAVAHFGKPWSYTGYQRVMRDIVRMISLKR
jgi:CheY-like chemotaxis protein